MRGAFATDLGEEEIIETIDVPKLSGAGRFGYYKFCRKTGEFAEASAAVGVRSAERHGTRFPRRAAAGAAAARRSRRAHRARGSGRHDGRVAEAVMHAAPDLDAIERRMATAVVTRALQQVLS